MERSSTCDTPSEPSKWINQHPDLCLVRVGMESHIIKYARHDTKSLLQGVSVFSGDQSIIDAKSRQMFPDGLCANSSLLQLANARL